MNKRKIVLGLGTLMLAAMGAFATAKTAVVNAYYFSIGGTHCKGTEVLPCPNTGTGCIKAIPEEGGASFQLYRSIASEAACRTQLQP